MPRDVEIPIVSTKSFIESGESGAFHLTDVLSWCIMANSEESGETSKGTQVQQLKPLHLKRCLSVSAVENDAFKQNVYIHIHITCIFTI